MDPCGYCVENKLLVEGSNQGPVKRQVSVQAREDGGWAKEVAVVVGK